MPNKLVSVYVALQSQGSSSAELTQLPQELQHLDFQQREPKAASTLQEKRGRQPVLTKTATVQQLSSVEISPSVIEDYGDAGGWAGESEDLFKVSG